MLKEHKQPNMEVQLRDLRPALEGVAKVVRRKVTLPILGTIKVELSTSHTVCLTVTDLDVFFSIEVPAKVVGVPSARKTVPATSSFLVRFRELQEEMRRRQHAHPESTLNLSSMVCRTEKVSEFPAEPVVPSGPVMKLDERTVRGFLNAFASTSEDETRHVLRGVLVDATEAGKGKLVATDGRHMFVHEASGLPTLEEPFILPDHKIWTWKRLTSPVEPWSLSLEPSKDKSEGCNFRVEGSHWSVSGRCIEGNFPNYRQVIPDSSGFTSHVILPPEDLGSIAAAVAQLPGKKLTNRPIALEIDGKVATLLAKGTDRDNDDTASWVRMGIPMAVHRGPNLTVALNRDYLRRALQGGLNRIDMKDADSPLKFSRDGAFMIVMPVRLSAPPAFPRKERALQPKQKHLVSGSLRDQPSAPVPVKRVKAQVEPASSAPDHRAREEAPSNWIIGFTIWLFGGDKEKPLPRVPRNTGTQSNPQQAMAKTAHKPS